MKLPLAESLGRCWLMHRRLGGLGGDLDLLVNHHFVRELDLKGGWRLAFDKLNARLCDRLVTHRGAGQPVGPWDQPGKLESSSLAGSYRATLRGKSRAP